MMSVAATSRHPLPASPIKREVSHPVWGEILRQSLSLHLPLDGGGREGVSASSMSSISTLAPGAAA